MTNTPSHIADGTTANFPQLVLDNSAKGPVLVYFWSPRAGPCLMLLPRLVQLATEFGGRFLLVLLNTDERGPLARHHGVMSVPTIKLFRNGQIVDTLHGAKSTDVLHRFVEQHLPARCYSFWKLPGDLGRNAMLLLFALLGEDDDLVQRFRPLLPT